MEGKIKYFFSVKLWKSSAPGGWHFVSLPTKISKEIRSNLKWQEEGWGRMRVVAQIDDIKWDTAIWYDSKIETYLLPIKSKIRTKLSLKIDEVVEMVIWV